MSPRRPLVVHPNRNLPMPELPKGFRLVRIGRETYFVQRGYELIPCDGPAHANLHQDHCTRCAPLWGVRPVRA